MALSGLNHRHLILYTAIDPVEEGGSADRAAETHWYTDRKDPQGG